jgi:hypothetical protein
MHRSVVGRTTKPLTPRVRARRAWRVAWRRTSALFLSSVTAGMAFAVPAYGVTFNAPHATPPQQQAISRSLDALIDGAPRGSTIRLVTYSFNDEGTAARLLAAHRRGVNVRMLGEASVRSPVWGKFTSAFGTDMRRGSWARLCSNGCLGTQYSFSVLHSKFTTFSMTGGKAQVALVTSSNPTIRQEVVGANNAVKIVGDAGVYGALNRYFSDLAAGSAGARQPNYFRSVDSGRYTITMFPAASGRNPVLSMLDRVSCVGGTRITIAMSLFNAADIARKLWQLDDAGCRVRLMYSNVDTHVADRVWPELTRPGGRFGGIELFYSGYNYTTYDGTVRLATAHHKFVLIDGTYDGRAGQKIAVTGSLTWTWNSVRNNDELMLTIRDPGVYDEFAARFNYHLYASRTRLDRDCAQLRSVHRNGVALPGVRIPAGAVSPQRLWTKYMINKRLDPDRDGTACPVSRSRLSARASPGDRVRSGGTVTVTGALLRARIGSGTYVGYPAQRVQLQFRPINGPYQTVATLQTNSRGELRAQPRQHRSGCWRWVYRGSGNTAAATAKGDCVTTT